VLAPRPGFADQTTTAFSRDIPFVHVRSVDGRWTGWVESIHLEPIIPDGTRLKLETVGAGEPSVSPSRHGQLQQPDVVLGSPVSVVVIHQDPPADGDCSLHVRVTSGLKRGATGWSCENGKIEGTQLSAGWLNVSK
jgi:hypothetical protein